VSHQQARGKALSAVRLVLEDGTELSGRSFGAARAVGGEVVFNTAMTGYVETLTDPSYRGQILVCTYPLIGNYGVPAPRAAGALDAPYESSCIQVQGLVVQHYVADHSHHAATRSLGQWLIGENVPAVCGIDTRTLTRRLRERGTMRGWLLPDGHAQSQAESVDMKRDVFDLVAPAAPVYYAGTGRDTILVVDVGAKDNIVRSLLQRGVGVVRVPWRARLADFAGRVDGMVIGNGPGDPRDLDPLVAQLRTLIGDYARPIFGVCLGNQVLARAAGAETFKLPYGHRGVNQPVQDLLTGRCFVTSQNHGYAVDAATLPAGWEPWFTNLNDGSNEGIRSRVRPFASVQFHPEAHPGPQDTGFLFDEFLGLTRATAGR
jgi:carbamoyl-phosphate synthase small subunit